MLKKIVENFDIRITKSQSQDRDNRDNLDNIYDWTIYDFGLNFLISDFRFFKIQSSIVNLTSQSYI